MDRARFPLLVLVFVPLASCGEGQNEPVPCRTNADCKLPAMCSKEGLCAAPEPIAEGGTCLHPAHCQSGLCVDQGKGGVCVKACGEPADCATEQRCLPARGEELPRADNTEKPAPALRLLCQRASTGAHHLGEACAQHADCASGLCHEGQCTQVCREQCPAPLSCQPATLVVESSTLKSNTCRSELLQTIELGAVQVPQDGLAEPLTFTIAPGVQSFLVLADDRDDLRVALTRLEAPDGTLFVSYADPPRALMRAFDELGTATVQVPGTDNPQGVVQAGTYKLWVQTHQPVSDKLEPVAGKIERVAVLMRNSVQRGGLLDLDLHFSPGTGLSAATAPEDGFVQETLTELARLYRELLGVSLGVVRYFDLSASEDVVSDSEQARTMRKTYSQPGPHALSASIFFVQSIAVDDGFEGLAGGIPGVPGLAGRPLSGIIVKKQSSSQTMGRLLAHELGHFLGLYHTSEQGGKSYDKIGDTPECAGGTVREQCPDYHNLMFPYYLYAPEPLALSAGQTLVLQGSPFFYELSYPEACGPSSAVVDVTQSGFASGTTRRGSQLLAGSCGGGGQNERVHLYRLAADAHKALEVEVRGRGFAPLVYVRQGSCSGKELACQLGQPDTPLKLTLSAPAPDAYYIVVDAATGGGDYTLDVHEVTP